jgi:hypothetical protein
MRKDAQFRIDDEATDQSELEPPFPLDPGKHTVSATPKETKPGSRVGPRLTAAACR